MARIFGVPTILLRALSTGSPGLHDALVKAMKVAGADPEVHVLRDASDQSTPPRWTIGVVAGDYIEELALDMTAPDAAQAAMSLFLIAIVEELRHERPDILGQPIVIDAIVRMLYATSKAAARERPS